MFFPFAGMCIFIVLGWSRLPDEYGPNRRGLSARKKDELTKYSEFVNLRNYDVVFMEDTLLPFQHFDVLHSEEKAWHNGIHHRPSETGCNWISCSCEKCLTSSTYKNVMSMKAGCRRKRSAIAMMIHCSNMTHIWKWGQDEVDDSKYWG